MIGLVEAAALAGAVLAALTWVGVVRLAPRDAAPPSSPIARRALVARGWLYAPLWVPALLVVAALVPDLLGALWAASDHCQLPGAPSHHHLCIVHPPHPSEHALTWALPLAILLPALGLFAVRARGAWRESRLVANLLRLSQPSAVAPGVREIEHEAPLALTLGWWRPTILLSSGLIRGVSGPTLAAVIEHERAHVRRGDTRAALLDRLAASLAPARVAGPLLARIVLAREQACDLAAAQQVGGRAEVARALTEVARLGMAPPAAGISVASCALEARVLYLLQPAVAPARTYTPLLLVAGLFALGAGLVHGLVEHVLTYLLH